MQDFINRWSNSDLFTALAHVPAAGDPVATARAHHALIRDLYWKKKNLPSVVAVACAGIAGGLRASLDHTGESIEPELLGIAKGMAYDLGSFTWPGWDEPGIAIGPTDLALGREAANLNLRLAVELLRGDLAISRAHWLVGAHQLAAGECGNARVSFAQAEPLARTAGKPAEALLATAYIRLAEALADLNDPSKQSSRRRCRPGSRRRRRRQRTSGAGSYGHARLLRRATGITCPCVIEAFLVAAEAATRTLKPGRSGPSLLGASIHRECFLRVSQPFFAAALRLACSLDELEEPFLPPASPPLRPDPLFWPPPVSLFTVAQARRSASLSETPLLS